MTRNQSKGFSLLELIIVIVIGSVLLSVAVGKIGRTRDILSAVAARQAYMALHARTRSQAIEFGATARLLLDIQGDSAWIVQGGNTIETYRFAPDRVDVQSSSSDAVVQMCMVARGYSEPRCNSFVDAITLRFVTAQASESIVLLPMGQVRW